MDPEVVKRRAMQYAAHLAEKKKKEREVEYTLLLEKTRQRKYEWGYLLKNLGWSEAQITKAWKLQIVPFLQKVLRRHHPALHAPRPFQPHVFTWASEYDLETDENVYVSKPIKMDFCWPRCVGDFPAYIRRNNRLWRRWKSMDPLRHLKEVGGPARMIMVCPKTERSPFFQWFPKTTTSVIDSAVTSMMMLRYHENKKLATVAASGGYLVSLSRQMYNTYLNSYSEQQDLSNHPFCCVRLDYMGKVVIACATNPDLDSNSSPTEFERMDLDEDGFYEEMGGGGEDFNDIIFLSEMVQYHLGLQNCSHARPQIQVSFVQVPSVAPSSHLGVVLEKLSDQDDHIAMEQPDAYIQALEKFVSQHFTLTKDQLLLFRFQNVYDDETNQHANDDGDGELMGTPFKVKAVYTLKPEHAGLSGSEHASLSGSEHAGLSGSEHRGRFGSVNDFRASEIDATEEAFSVNIYNRDVKISIERSPTIVSNTSTFNFCCSFLV